MKNNIFLVLSAIICTISSANSLQISSNGGYDIVIAIDENTPVPGIGVGSYVQNIKRTVQVLSNQLWRATNQVFFINSVDLLIPSGWTTTELDGDATIQSFATADLRLSESINFPFAENSHACGKPGEFIGLPTSFFHNANAGDYGPSWKALINLWARYRWGVWDEHGYIGDSVTAKRFSYSYKPLGERNWVLTGCSNVILEGAFVNQEDNDVICQTNNHLIPPSNDCRFKPSSNNTATTSLMHLHWLDSVDSFCDETNHNKFAPNKQNLHCNHRSITEVMVSTSDYAAVTNPSTTIPTLTLKTVRSSQKPLLYVLLDRGSIEGPITIAAKIQSGLIPLFTEEIRQDTIAALGTFPGNLSEGSYIKEEVSWSRIGDNQDNFLRALGHLDTLGEPTRDFGLALKEVANKIKIKNPANGAIILVVKYGSAGPIDSASFANITSEAEVLAELKEQNIMVASIELAKSNGPSRSHLVNVARESGGLYSTLDSVGESDSRISSVVLFLNRFLSGIDQSLFTNTKTIIKRRTSADKTSNIPIPRGIDSNLQIFYTTPADLSSASFALTVAGTNNTVSFIFSKNFEWNEDIDNGRKFMYILEVQKEQLNAVEALNLQVICSESAEKCNNVNELATARFNATAFENVEVIVSTSAERNSFDLSVQAPFAIFAKVTKNSKPISNVMVSAIVSQIGSNTPQTVALVDDGLGGPDLDRDDGIYSAYYIPKQDGSIKISISVQKNNAPATTTGFVSRLLPVDQENFGCESGSCQKESLLGNYEQSIDYPISIAFTGANSFVATPSKISDLQYSETNTSGYLTWTSPSIPGIDRDKVSSYVVKKSGSLEILLNDFDNCEDAGQPTRPVGPGENQTQLVGVPTETTHYAVRPFFYTKAGIISNIVTKEYDPDQVIPTTTSTTTTSITTTSRTSSTPSSNTTSPISSTTPGGQTTEEPATVDDDPWIQRPVGYITVIVIILAVFALAGGGYWFMKKRNSSLSFSNLSDSKEVLPVRSASQESQSGLATEYNV